MKKRLIGLGLVTAGAVVPAMLAAPAPRGPRGPSIDDLVRSLRKQGLQGRDLVSAAIHEVAAAYRYYSVRHLWETPEMSLGNRRGWSHQYNVVLARVLDALGFETRLVHTPWLQGGDHPWWHNGHTWVKVRIDGRWWDACASRATHEAGDLTAVPGSEELPYHRRTNIALSLWMVPFVTFQVWKSWLTGDPLPGWIYAPRR